MDWYSLLNSLRIAAISAVVVFFAGIAAAYLLYRQASPLDQGCAGCDIDAASRAAARSGRLSAAAGSGNQAHHRRMGLEALRHPADNDLMIGYFRYRGSGFRSDASHGARRL